MCIPQIHSVVYWTGWGVYKADYSAGRMWGKLSSERREVRYDGMSIRSSHSTRSQWVPLSAGVIRRDNHCMDQLLDSSSPTGAGAPRTNFTENWVLHGPELEEYLISQSGRFLYKLFLILNMTYHYGPNGSLSWQNGGLELIYFMIVDMSSKEMGEIKIFVSPLEILLTKQFSV